MTPVVVTSSKAVLLPGVVPNYDASFHLAWGRDLLAGLPLDLSVPSAPTPHPLPLLGGVVLAALPRTVADRVFAVAAVIALLALLALLARTAHEVTHDRTATALAVVLGLTSAPLGLLMLGGSSDVVHAALGLGAVVLTLRQRWVPAIALWLAAALVRPEAALLAAVPLVLALRAEHEAGVRRRATTLYVAGTTLVAAVWVGMGALAGDPLVALHSAADNAVLNDNPRGPLAGVTTALPGLAGATGWWTVAAAAVVLVAAGVLRRRRTASRDQLDTRGTTVVALYVAVAVAAYLAQGVLGTPLVARYLFLPALLCVVLATAAVPLVRSVAGRARPTVRRTCSAALVLALVGGAVVAGVPGWRDLMTATRTRAEVMASAENLLDSDLVRGCPGQVTVRSPAVAAVTALRLDRPLRDVRVGSSADDGVLLQPLTLAAAELAGYGPLTPLAAQATFPADAPPRLQDAHWAVYSSCRP